MSSGQAVTLSDFYKTGHPHQYDKKIVGMYDNLTARHSRVKGVNHVIFFALQYLIKEYITKWYNERFFAVPEDIAVARYKRILDHCLGMDSVDVSHIRRLHKLGYLPIKIKALPEGARVPIKVPMMTVESTKKGGNFPWLPGFLEDIISCTIWGPITSATTAFRFRQMFNMYADLTVGDREFVQYQGHDFSMRGMYGLEAACMSGAAHLTCFVGSDTIPAIEFLEEYYGANIEEELVGCSIPATEHSVMCAGTAIYVWEKRKGNWEYAGECELELFRRLILEVYPKGKLSIVSDTWNLWRVINVFLPALRDEILAREGTIVIRPDSGDPVKILTGYDEKELAEHYDDDGNLDYYIVRGENPRRIYETEKIGLIQALFNLFGGSLTKMGYSRLDPHILAIYGDSITVERADLICLRLMKKGFASTNWVAGIGSYTYQFVTRDFYGMAIKATNMTAMINGVEMEIPLFKDPITDNGVKKSARGLLCVRKDASGEYYLVENCTREEEENNNLLQTVFEDGKLVKEWKLFEVRQNIEQSEQQAEAEATARSVAF